MPFVVERENESNLPVFSRFAEEWFCAIDSVDIDVGTVTVVVVSRIVIKSNWIKSKITFLGELARTGNRGTLRFLPDTSINFSSTPMELLLRQ